MNHEIEIVHQYPVRMLIALNVSRGPMVLLFQPFQDLVTDGLILPAVVAVTNHKEVGEAGNL